MMIVVTGYQRSITSLMMNLLQSLGKVPWVAKDESELKDKNPRGFFDCTARLKAGEHPDFCDPTVVCKLFPHDLKTLRNLDSSSNKVHSEIKRKILKHESYKAALEIYNELTFLAKTRTGTNNNP